MVEMDSESLRTLIDTAIDFHVAGDLHSALQCYSAALDVEPTNVLVLWNIGCLFEEAGFAGHATVMFAQVAKLETFYRDVDVVEAKKNYGKRGIN